MIRFREVELISGELRIKPIREDMGAAMALVRRHKNRLYDLEIKEHREKRSLDANAMAWALMGKLSATIGTPDEEIYRQYILDIGDNFEIFPVKEEKVSQCCRAWCEGHKGRQTKDLGPCRNYPGYRNIQMYYGSSDYDSKQMSRLLELIIEDCKRCGVEYLSERERSLLVDEWRENYG